jgi:ribulose-5-phosphate 4-epimerase/fuculose-1-phosphate aldolase
MAHERIEWPGAYDVSVHSHPPLRLDATEPTFATAAETRRHRQARLALAYRLFGAMHWGEQGDGHISARDPELIDCFWLLRYGVPFGAATVDDLVLVGPDGSVVDGEGEINPTAYYIHMPIHEARSEIVCAAHTHTGYGTPWSAMAQPFRTICQEAVAFHGDHAVFGDGEVDIQSTDGGKRIAAALGETKLVILRSHGLLTVGQSIDEAIGWYLMAERVSEVHVKAPDAEPISDEDAERCRASIAHPDQGWKTFNWAVRSRVADPTVVDG